MLKRTIPRAVRCGFMMPVCRRNGHTEADCARDIETVPLPEFSTASEACVTANDSNGVEPSTYRRLLPAAYSDGLQRVSGKGVGVVVVCDACG